MKQKFTHLDTTITNVNHKNCLLYVVPLYSVIYEYFSHYSDVKTNIFPQIPQIPQMWLACNQRQPDHSVLSSHKEINTPAAAAITSYHTKVLLCKTSYYMLHFHCN